MENKYIYYYARIFIIGLIILGAFNTAFLKIKYNNYEIYFNILVAICALTISFDRSLWLPFLGENILPSILIPLKDNNGDALVKVNVKPNTKIVYWSTLYSNKILDVKNAYGNFINSGVVMSDNNGIAILRFNKGSGYYIPSGKYLQPHVHYREVDNNLGMMGPIKTYFYKK